MFLFIKDVAHEHVNFALKKKIEITLGTMDFKIKSIKKILRES